jgi:polysaccharide export outer membrane protein
MISIHAARMSVTKLLLTAAAAMAFVPGAGAASDEAPRVSLRLSSELTTGIASAAPAAAAQPAIPKPVLQGTKDYRIGPEDLLEIQVFGVDQLTRTVRVNSRGNISLPLIGNVQVGGLTGSEAEAVIVSKLSESYLQDPQVSLFIKEYTSQRVVVEGAVNKPGVYPLRGSTSLLQTLAMAGGQGSLSEMKEVMLFRTDTAGRKETFVYDVDRIRSGEVDDPVVVSEDLIVVKRNPARVFFKDSVVHDFMEWLNPFR